MNSSKKKRKPLKSYKNFDETLQTRFAVVNIYREMLRDSKIEEGGAAHKRMNELVIKNYEEASKNQTK